MSVTTVLAAPGRTTVLAAGAQRATLTVLDAPAAAIALTVLNMAGIAGGAGPGTQGPPGPPGPAGRDGQIRFTGAGTPPAVIVGASPGDTYLDLDSGDIYKLT